jgi:4-hydroxybenzoate polyprenyltransferase
MSIRGRTSSKEKMAYQHPQSGILSYLPQFWVPYAELARIERPAGYLYAFWPCTWSTMIAASLRLDSISAGEILNKLLLWAVFCILVRSAGCVCNDIWDRDIDPHVERTRFRPLARNAVTVHNAMIFGATLLLCGLTVMTQLLEVPYWYYLPLATFVILYGGAKRVTYYPQVILGLTMGSGAVLGFPATGIDLFSDSIALSEAIHMVLFTVGWQVIVDMIYANVDVHDDRKIGVKSMAVIHSGKAVLVVMIALQALSIIMIGIFWQATLSFFIWTAGLVLLCSGSMVYCVNLNDPKSCMWWFKGNSWHVGLVTFCGFVGQYVVKKYTGVK